MDLERHKGCSPERCISDSSYKCKLVAAVGHQPNFEIDQYKVYMISNVISIGSTPRDNYGWDVEYDESAINNIPENYYLYIDGNQADAFAHWIFESAYYLPFLKKLKQLYPKIKLLSYRNKNYMNSIYKAFDISIEDVVHQIHPGPNRVFFLECSSLARHAELDVYMNHIDNFYKEMTRELPPVKKEIDILYLPRGTLENFKANDRIIPCQSQLVEILPIAYPKSKIYYTDKTDNMKDQIQLVRSASLIILDYGSSLMFNGFFAENTKILVLGNVHRHLENPRPYKLILDSEKRGVKYYYISSMIPVPEIIKIIAYLLGSSEGAFSHKLFCWKKCQNCMRGS